MKTVEKLSDLNLIIGKTVESVNYVVSSEGHGYSFSIKFTDGTYFMVTSDSYTRNWYDESWEEPMITINIKEGTSDGK